jgi:hypothetical protein
MGRCASVLLVDINIAYLCKLFVGARRDEVFSRIKASVDIAWQLGTCNKGKARLHLIEQDNLRKSAMSASDAEESGNERRSAACIGHSD